MIIDCHTHLGRNQHINASVDQLLKSMDYSGIDKSLVFAGEMSDCPNEWMLEQIAPHKDRLLGVAAYNPNWSFNGKKVPWGLPVQLADWYAEGKIAAVKFYTGYDHFYPSDVKGTLSRLEQVGCPAIFHSGDCLNSVKSAKLKYAHPMHIDEVAVDFPKMNFIIAHMGYPWVRDTAEVCYKNNNVYTDISGFVYGKFQSEDRAKFATALQEFASICPQNKLLFGTDWPISDQFSYRNTMCSHYVIGDHMEFDLTSNTKRAFNL